MESNSDEGIYTDLILVEESATSRKVKCYKKRMNPFERYEEQEFFQHYRLNKHTALYICDLVREELMPRTNHGGAISPEVIVLVSIRYLAKGAYQNDIGDLHNISQQSVSNCVKKFVTALASKIKDFINFPTDPETIRQLKTDFF